MVFQLPVQALALLHHTTSRVHRTGAVHVKEQPALHVLAAAYFVGTHKGVLERQQALLPIIGEPT